MCPWTCVLPKLRPWPLEQSLPFPDMARALSGSTAGGARGQGGPTGVPGLVPTLEVSTV